MTKDAPRSNASRGFTLIELMVALVAGSFVVAAAYSLSGLVARNFHEQTRVTDTQASLRTAMEQLKRDAARAGFLGARSTNELPGCSGNVTGLTQADVSPRPLHAIQVQPNRMTPQVVSAVKSADNLTRGDELLLTGNYATSDAYPITPDAMGAAGTVTLQPQHESFRRSFVNPADGAFIDTRFVDVFRVGRMLRFEDLDSGRILFRDITAANAADPTSPTINFAPNLPLGCLGSSVVVTPISLIRYRLEAARDNADLGRTTDTTEADADFTGSGRALLVRRELNMTDQSAMPGAMRIVLDYAVELQTNAWIDDGGGNFARVTDATAPSLVDVSANTPVAFRALGITLTARTPESQARPGGRPFVAPVSRNGRGNLDDPYLMFFQRESADRQTQFYARARTLRSDVFLPNMVNRPGLRP